MKIRINPGALLFSLMLLLAGKAVFFAAFFAAAFHELGHLCAARGLHVRIRMLELDLFGAKLYPAVPFRDYRTEWLLAAGGPLFSILLAAALLPFCSGFPLLLRTASASFALFNLLPIAGFDGGRMLYALFAARLPLRMAERLLSAGTYLSLLFLFCLSACLLLRYGENLALLVLSASLFARIFLPTHHSC